MSLILALGTNLGDKHTNLLTAIKNLESVFGNYISISQVYSSSAWGKTDQPDFYNMCIEFSLPKLTPLETLKSCLAIELEMGRVRIEHWGPRLIDIDILYFSDLTHTEAGLTIPHPRIKDRSFVVRPLRELKFFEKLNNIDVFPESFDVDAMPVTDLSHS